jgi:serine/threonine protein kinase
VVQNAGRSTKKGVILKAICTVMHKVLIIKLLKFCAMTTSEKIKQLQSEVRLLRKLVLSNADNFSIQRQAIGELYRQIEQFQSFIADNRRM